MPCSKAKFPTKESAIAKINSIRDTDKRASKKPIRSYLCPSCGFWHLTSFTKAKQKALEQRKFTPEGLQYTRIAETAKEWIKKKGWDKD